MEATDDVWRAACAAAKGYGEKYIEASGNGVALAYLNIEICTNAILAERKRCAEVARHLNGWGPVGGSVVAEHIAKVIEAGQ